MLEFPTKTFQLLHSYDTIYCADSVEWCPFAPHQHYFVCANYQLEDDKSNGTSDQARERFGRVLLFCLDLDGELVLKQTIHTAAVLDQKWCPKLINNSPLLGIVDAKNSLQIYKLNSLSELELITVYKFNIPNDIAEILILSLDWSSNGDEIVCSDSKGNVHLLKLEDDRLELIKSWHAHEYEAWICSFSHWDENLIFSGGDDSVFTRIDKRCDAILKNRTHNAGVTCMHSNPKKEFTLATGSLSGELRLWDVRNVKSYSTEMKIDATIWRLKWDPFNFTYLLAACMGEGAHVVDCTNIDELQIVDSFYKHESLVYGADWCYLSKVNDYPQDGNCIVGTCSFYDHLLCISKINLNNLN